MFAILAFKAIQNNGILLNNFCICIISLIKPARSLDPRLHLTSVPTTPASATRNIKQKLVLNFAVDRSSTLH